MDFNETHFTWDFESSTRVRAVWTRVTFSFFFKRAQRWWKTATTARRTSITRLHTASVVVCRLILIQYLYTHTHYRKHLSIWNIQYILLTKKIILYLYTLYVYMNLYTNTLHLLYFSSLHTHFPHCSDRCWHCYLLYKCTHTHTLQSCNKNTQRIRLVFFLRYYCIYNEI